MKPKFKIGMELECAFDDDYQNEFEEALGRLHPDMDFGTDGSIDEDRRLPASAAFEGREIRTPPLPLDQGLKLFEKTIVLMNRFTLDKKLFTNTSCGLHVNLSEEFMVQRFDRFSRFYAHLVTVFPEREVLKTFRRTNNTYCHPLFTKKGQKQADWMTIQALAMSEKFGTDKYHAIGLHNGRKDAFDVKARRVEFRCLGGKDYHIQGYNLGRTLDLIIASATDAFERTIVTADEVTGKVRELVDKDIPAPRYVACDS